MVVVDQVGDELVGLPRHEAVEPLEATAERPAGPAGPRVALVFGGEMPLADGVGGVPGLDEHLGEEPVGEGDPRVVARIAGGDLDHPSHAVGVMVPAGQHAGPRGRAQGGGVKVGVAQALGGQAVEGRGGDIGAEAAELGEPDVVEHDDDDVRRTRGCPHRFGPARRRFVEVAPDHSAKRFIPHCSPLSATGSQLIADGHVPMTLTHRGAHRQPCVRLGLIHGARGIVCQGGIEDACASIRC